MKHSIFDEVQFEKSGEHKISVVKKNCKHQWMLLRNTSVTCKILGHFSDALMAQCFRSFSQCSLKFDSGYLFIPKLK